MLYFVSGLFREHWTIFKINHFWHLSLKKMSSQCRLILILLNHDLSKTIISIQPLFSLHQIRLATFNRKSKIALLKRRKLYSLKWTSLEAWSPGSTKPLGIRAPSVFVLCHSEQAAHGYQFAASQDGCLSTRYHIYVPEIMKCTWGK